MDLDQINLNTYEEISKEFSETRAYVWKCVKDFTSLITNTNNEIIEIGCGNGKNIEYIKTHTKSNVIGIDTCKHFVEICQKKRLNVIESSSTNLPYPDNHFDYLLCIAMFHHLLSIEDQTKSMKEFIRVMKPHSHGIITCWSVEQPDNSKFIFTEGINIVPWKGRQDINKIRYYYVYSQKMFQEYFETFTEIKIINIYNEVGNWILLFTKK
jgi:ubiquinone/menaquinone biosynthesis C-methylase UbiE